MEKVQRSKIMKDTGSLMNFLMGNNKSVPVVGKGATVLSWTDRRAYEVMSVSEDLKRVVVQEYVPERIDKNGISESQQYKYETLSGYDTVIVWRHNKWRIESEIIEFTKEYAKTIGPKFWDSEDHKLIFPNDSQFPVLIPGKTVKKKMYSEIKILWGVKEHYEDPCF